MTRCRSTGKRRSVRRQYTLRPRPCILSGTTNCTLPHEIATGRKCVPIRLGNVQRERPPRPRKQKVYPALGVALVWFNLQGPSTRFRDHTARGACNAPPRSPLRPRHLDRRLRSNLPPERCLRRPLWRPRTCPAACCRIPCCLRGGVALRGRWGRRSATRMRMHVCMSNESPVRAMERSDSRAGRALAKRDGAEARGLGVHCGRPHTSKPYCEEFPWRPLRRTTRVYRDSSNTAEHRYTDNSHARNSEPSGRIPPPVTLDYWQRC